MKTLTLASIYELQGLKAEALEIYKELLMANPENKEAKIDRKSTRLNSSHLKLSRMPSSA